MIRTLENITKTVEEHKAIWDKLQDLKKKEIDNYLTSSDEVKNKIALKIKKKEKQLEKSFKNL